MGIMKPLAKIGTFGLAGLALSGHKKKPDPSMLNQGPVWRQGMTQPTSAPSMIGDTKWGL